MPRTLSFRDRNLDPVQVSAPSGKGITLTRSYRFARQGAVILSLGLLIAVTCLAPVPALGQAPQDDPNPATRWDTLPRPSHVKDAPPPTKDDGPRALIDKRKLILQANFEKTKKDAAEMAALAKELHEEMNKPNAEALSPEIVDLADKIEKLARKVRGETKGF